MVVVCLFVCLFVCLIVHLFVCLFVGFVAGLPGIYVERDGEESYRGLAGHE